MGLLRLAARRWHRRGTWYLCWHASSIRARDRVSFKWANDVEDNERLSASLICGRQMWRTAARSLWLLDP
jgi:hypothetical protein